MYHKAKNDNSEIVICDMIDHYENGTKKYLNCTKYTSVYTVTPSACNKLFKKSIINNLTFLKGKWYEDFNFTTKVLLKKPKISVISEGYYNCHAHSSSIMNSTNSIKNLDMIDVIDDLIVYAKNKKLYDENIFKYLIFNHILITTINRVSLHKNDDKNEVISTLRKYCHDNLTNYKKLEFYKTIPKARKIVATLNYYGLHNISKALLNIKAKIKGGFYEKN